MNKMKIILKLLIVVIVTIINAIITGFVFSKLWGWFIISILQVRQISIVEAIGIILIISFIRAKQDIEITKENFWKLFTDKTIFTITLNAIILLLGYIITLFL